MKKINAALLTMGIVFSLESCKKEESSKVDCEIKLTTQLSPSGSQNIITRFNAAGQVVAFVTPEESFSYVYNKNEAVASSAGHEVYRMTLENGRVVHIVLNGSKDVQKISYDTEGRMKKFVLESNGVVGNVYSYFYSGGNLDYILEEVGGEQGVERKYSFEYTGLKTDAGMRSYLSNFGVFLGNAIPVTLLGTGSVNLPSKKTYTVKGDITEVIMLNEYNYVTSADGRISSVKEENVYKPATVNLAFNVETEISSTCR